LPAHREFWVRQALRCCYWSTGLRIAPEIAGGYGHNVELTNWGGGYIYCAGSVHEPATLEQVQELVASRPRLRVLGSRHSFTDIGDSAELLTLRKLPSEVEVDRVGRTVSFTANLTYGELIGRLNAEHMALANLASLPHISAGGAVATATHGSGDRNGNLATAVSAIDLVTSDGELRHLRRGDHDFEGAVVSFGALGAVTRITLDLEPAYEIRQHVFEGLSWESLFEHFDEITSSGYSVSVFTRWGASVDQVWLKTRAAGPLDGGAASLFGASPATADRHPILGLDPVSCTPQLGRAGPWSDRLPHFRLGFTPSSGAEIQSEYLVPRPHAVAAIEAVRARFATIAPLVQVSEIRTVAADELWMSPQARQDTIGIHFTWRLEPTAVQRALVDVEAALNPFGARPHWGEAVPRRSPVDRVPLRSPYRLRRAGGAARPAPRLP
jgi:alditol oxidase